ncbi:MAG: hypothetical protein H6703_01795 [Myxococcales bacterium]|nr:hypothetical protein [Myxococcales bacterium]
MIERLRAGGASVVTVAGDVTRAEDVAAALAVEAAVPLRGVLHAAGRSPTGCCCGRIRRGRHERWRRSWAGPRCSTRRWAIRRRRWCCSARWRARWGRRGRRRMRRRTRRWPRWRGGGGRPGGGRC